MTYSSVSEHYRRNDLVEAIRAGVAQMGKTIKTINVDDLAPIDEFHIGGRGATEELLHQIAPSEADHILDVGCGLGGAARFISDRTKCRVTGVDLTPDYVNAGNTLCQWLGLDGKVFLRQGNALALPFPEAAFSGAYMLHVGMNIQDKVQLIAEVARVLEPGRRFAIYDVMKTGDGALQYPLPWATTQETNAIDAPEQYEKALLSTGFKILSQRNRRDYALAYFANAQSKLAVGPAPLGLHTLMGERRGDQIRNMIANVSAGRIAPVEMIAERR